MKKLLILAIIMAAGCNVMGQRIAARAENELKFRNWHTPATEPAHRPGYAASLPVNDGKGVGDIAKVFIGSSENAFSVLVQEQTCMDYDPVSGALINTHRGDHITPGFGNGYDAVVSFSDDGGLSWANKIGFQGSLTDRCRYPSGRLFNPAGSTLINNLYSVVAGPITNGTAWTKAYLGSRTYEALNQDQQLFPLATEQIFRFGMAMTDNGIFSVGSVKTTSSALGYTDLKLETLLGNWNGTTNSFDCAFREVDPTPYLYFHKGYYETSYFGNACYSNDGSIGYMWAVGVDNRAPEGCAYYPVIFKTLDGGTSWEVLDFFDFGILPDVYAHLTDLKAQPGRVSPQFQEAYLWEINPDSYVGGEEMDGVVDSKGNFHLFAVCGSATSLHPDSLTWFWNTNESLFEFEYNLEANQWRGWWIDTLRTDPVGLFNSPLETDGDPNKVTWDHRLQASVSPDGNKVFAVWTDTDPEFWGLTGNPADLYPDIKVWGRDINTNMHTPSVSKTYLQEGFGECYFMFVSPRAVEVYNPKGSKAGGYSEIPVSIVDIATNGFNADEPVFHYYLKGIRVADADFTITGSRNRPEPALVEALWYPNPCRQSAKLDLDLQHACIITVSVTSPAGQELYFRDYGLREAGAQTITLEDADLTPGIYICRVRAGDTLMSGKLAVE